MGFKPARVALERIDTADGTYRITTQSTVDDLKASIAAVGLINPVLLAAGSVGYTIVSGFRRVAACRQLGWIEIAARIADPAVGSLALARLAISDNSGQRALNLLEKARALSLLARDPVQPAELVDAAGELGITDSPDVVKKLLNLSKLPGSIQTGVAEQTLPLPVALEIGGYPPETALRLAGLFSELKPSLNRQREMLGLLKEIARREDTGMAEVMCDPQVAAILADSEIDRNQKNRRLLDWLRRRRFPRICYTEAAFARLLKNVRLGPGGSLLAPKNFEASTFTLQLPFRDLAGLKKHRDALNSLIENPALIEFLADRFNINA